MDDAPEFLADMLGLVIREYIQVGARAEREGRFADAEKVYRDWMAALPMDPRAKWSLALLLLSDGRYEEGFKLYDARLDIPELGISGPARTLSSASLLTADGMLMAV